MNASNSALEDFVVRFPRSSLPLKNKQTSVHVGISSDEKPRRSTLTRDDETTGKNQAAEQILDRVVSELSQRDLGTREDQRLAEVFQQERQCRRSK